MVLSRTHAALIGALLAAASVCALTGCPEKTDGSSGAPSATTTATATTATPSASVSATPSATMTASATPSASAVPSASAATSASAKPTTSAAASASAGSTCGSKTDPCPLQKWMQQNANPAVSAGDTAQLATVLAQIVKYAPPGYSNWTSIANDGATAAKNGDLAGAKASCASCHKQYKDKYKAELKDRKI